MSHVQRPDELVINLQNKVFANYKYSARPKNCSWTKCPARPLVLWQLLPAIENLLL